MNKEKMNKLEVGGEYVIAKKVTGSVKAFLECNGYKVAKSRGNKLVVVKKGFFYFLTISDSTNCYEIKVDRVEKERRVDDDTILDSGSRVGHLLKIYVNGDCYAIAEFVMDELDCVKMGDYIVNGCVSYYKVDNCYDSKTKSNNFIARYFADFEVGSK